MAIKNFKTKEEALAAMKKATDRKRCLLYTSDAADEL